MKARFFALLVMTVTVATGCKTATKPPGASAPRHDASPTAIECPLAKKHLDPSKMRPFEDVEKYIAFLDRPDRASWQRPDAVVAALGLTGSETVADVGAGSGYFTFPLARALPRGKVFAIDIEPEMVRHVHHKVMTEGITNVQAVVGDADDPAIPAGTDVVFVCDVLHHVADRPAWMGKLSNEMKPGARLVVVEFKEGDLPQGPPKAAKIPRADIVALAAGAGLPLVGEKPDLLPYQTFLVFRKGS
jgi:2-polyprenyl-3-methyl-5-hydroxy-6-metoxy-1,4-benzoquinol methylase